MKITSKICGVTRSYRGGVPRLAVACEDDGVGFTVPDTAASRAAYAIGRDVTVTITPGRAR